jgi:hypothetical protein
MRKDTIRLLAGDGSFLHWTSTDDARSKLLSGVWEEVYDARARFAGLRKRVVYLSSASESPAAITARESQAAVGATLGESRNDQGVLLPHKEERRAAQKKIESWPEITDNDQGEAPRAVMINAGRVRQPKHFKQPKLDPNAIYCFA